MRFAILVMVGCGRINLDPIENLAGDDGGPDIGGLCPDDTIDLQNAANTCIEKTERGYKTWVDADTTCRGLGRRLCTDAEWALACGMPAGLTEMTSDVAGFEWEWVAEVANEQGSKRGYELCGDIATHEIFLQPYDFRCCVDRI